MTKYSAPKKLFLAIAVSTLSAATTSVRAGAAGSLMQTAPVLTPGTFEAKIQADIILNDGGGFNIGPHFRFGIVEHYLDAEVMVGTGTTDFQVGASAKYNILPDLEGQIGLSGLFGVSYSRDNEGPVSVNAFIASFGLLASKSLTASFGQISPYGAFQVESYVAKNFSRAPITILGGAKFDIADVKWGFYSELGLNVHESAWSISGGVSHNF